MGWGGYNLVSLEVNDSVNYRGRIKTLALPLGKGQGKKYYYHKNKILKYRPPLYSNASVSF